MPRSPFSHDFVVTTLMLWALMSPRLAVGEIFRWSDASRPIPGTEGITLRPGVVLDGRDLSFGEFRLAIDADNNWTVVDLQDASFVGANLTGSLFSGANLTNVNFSGADLTRAHFGGNPVASPATLLGANFSNAKIAQADLGEITREQLYATYSYKVRDLAEIKFRGDLQDWSFDDQSARFADFRYTSLNRATFRNADLVGADFIFSDLTSANLSGADVRGACFAVRGEDAWDTFDVVVDSATKYDQWTVFPKDFDAKAADLEFFQTSDGDFDANGILDIRDLARFRQRFGSPNCVETNSARFDLTHDDVVDELDVSAWVRHLRGTWVGDANLDGEFNSTDLVRVFQAGQYEIIGMGLSTWETGDWNMDFQFNSGDLVFAFQDGGYEQGPRDQPAVPEPAGLILLIAGVLSSLFGRNVRCPSRIS